MFNNLIESKPKKQRSTAGTVTSVILHGILLSAAVYATAQATMEAEKPKEEKVEFVEMKKDEPPPPKNEPPPPPPPEAVAAPPPPKGFQVLTAPVEIPDVIPKVDLSRKVVDEADFSGKGVAGGTSKGDPNVKSAPVISDNQTYFEFQVEKQAAALPGEIGKNLRYPSTLQAQNVEGKVTAQFVVDTTGRAEMGSWKILETSNELFSQAAKDAVRSSRFYPAEVGGRKVRQLVQLPLAFTLNK
jgi:protein TonB